MPWWHVCHRTLVCVQALRDVPEVNSAWMGDFIRQYDSVHVSVAVQTPSGLMVPVIRNTDTLGLSDINAQVKALAAKVRILSLQEICPLFRPSRKDFFSLPSGDTGTLGLSDINAQVKALASKVRFLYRLRRYLSPFWQSGLHLFNAQDFLSLLAVLSLSV